MYKRVAVLTLSLRELGEGLQQESQDETLVVILSIRTESDMTPSEVPSEAKVLSAVDAYLAVTVRAR